MKAQEAMDGEEGRRERYIKLGDPTACLWPQLSVKVRNQLVFQMSDHVLEHELTLF